MIASIAEPAMLTNVRSVHEMALEGDLQAVQQAAQVSPGCLGKTDDSGRLPLHWAVSKAPAIKHNGPIRLKDGNIMKISVRNLD